MSERRRKYRYDRILIESERILDPEFDDAVVFLSGAQIEMLRNMTQYLRRLDTYVTETHLGYYVTPTVADYDDILAIVADLEETLMGNPNTIWGYNDVLAENDHQVSDTNGVYYLSTAQVPANEVWRITGVSVMRTSEAPSIIRVQPYIDGTGVYVEEIAPTSNWVYYPSHIDVTFNESDRFIMQFVSSVIGENCRVHYWGYKMVVP